MTLPSLSLLLASSGAFPVPEASPAGARTEPAPFAEPEVSDEELAGMRGGVSLPGGVDVSIAVRTETSLDGGLLLRSVYQVTQNVPTLQVYAPAPGQSVPTRNSTTTTTETNSGGAGVAVMFDRQNGVAFVQNMGGAIPAVKVTIGPAAPVSGPIDTLAPLNLGAGPVETAGGTVTLLDLPGGQYSHLEGNGLQVSHLFGNALGAIVANTGSGRVIDTETTISLDLRGATQFNLGSTAFRVEALAFDSVRQLVR